MKKTSPLLVAFVTVAIDLLGFGIVLPLLPLYGDYYLQGVSDVMRGTILGLLMASFSAMQFLFAPLWGRLSDRIGRRPVLMVGLAGSVVFYALFGYATLAGSMVLLFVARLGAGVAGATIGTAQAVIADCTPPEKRAKGMALIGMAFGIGFTLGPVLGSFWVPTWVEVPRRVAPAMIASDLGALAGGLPGLPPGAAPAVVAADLAAPAVVLAGEPPSAAPGFVASALSLAALLLAFFRLPETRQIGVSQPRHWLNLEGWRLALGQRPVAIPLLTFFVATFAFANFEGTVARFTKDVLGFSLRGNFYLFAFIGFVLMLTQGLLVRRFVTRVGEVAMSIAGVGLMLVGLAWLGVVLELKVMPDSYVLAGVLTGMTLAVVGFACLTPSAQALISRRSSIYRQGEILGVNQSASAIARILGPFLGNVLYNLLPSHTLPYYFGAGMMALALVLAFGLRQEPIESGQPG